MAFLTPAQAVAVIDKLTAMYSDLQTGVIAAQGTADDLVNIVEGSTDASFRDIDLQAAFANTTKTMRERQLSENTIFAGVAQGFFGVLSSQAALLRSVSTAIGDIDSFAFYYNFTDATKNQCLLPPQWRAAFYALGGSGYQQTGANARYPNPKNLYVVVLEGGIVDQTSTPNGLARYDVATDTFTDGYAVDRTVYGGGFARIKWTGGAGAGACTIVVAGTDEDGTARTYELSGTWGVGDFIATQPGVLLTPSAADKRITNVTGVTVTGMTAGDMYVEAVQPTGRTYPPA